MSDDIKKPDHYMIGDSMEVLDIIKAAGWFPAFAKGCIIKYTLRAGHKDGQTAVKDMRKAARYASELADFLNEENH